MHARGSRSRSSHLLLQGQSIVKSSMPRFVRNVCERPSTQIQWLNLPGTTWPGQVGRELKPRPVCSAPPMAAAWRQSRLPLAARSWPRIPGMLGRGRRGADR